MADRLPKDLLELITSYMPMFDIVIMSQMNSSFRKRITENINIKKHIKNEIDYMTSPFGVKINKINRIDKPIEFVFIHHSVNSIIDNDDKIDISKFKYDGDDNILYDGYEIVIQIDGLYPFHIASNVKLNNRTSIENYKIKLSNNRHSSYIYLLKIIDFKVKLSDIVRMPIINAYDSVQIINSIHYNKIYQLMKTHDTFNILISPRIHHYQNRKILSYITIKLKVYPIIFNDFDDPI